MSGEDKAQAGLSYGKYLRLDRLLSAQKLESARHGRLAHDEMLFIITHQAYELWFKQILFELDAVQATFARDRVDDRDIGQVTRGLDRVTEILKLVVLQLDVLETMTPLDFLEFRDLLYPASGFQSAQFREIEVRLGLRPEDRLRFDDQPFENRLDEPDRARIRAVAARPSLADQVEAWLARTPFVEMGGYTFREAYRTAVAEMLRADAEQIRASATLGDERRRSEIASLEEAMTRFDSIFDEARHARQVEAGTWRMSARALQAALFINLYRDEPGTAASVPAAQPVDGYRRGHDHLAPSPCADGAANDRRQGRHRRVIRPRLPASGGGQAPRVRRPVRAVDLPCAPFGPAATARRGAPGHGLFL